jgi:hypothetical protein
LEFGESEKSKVNELLEYVFDYERLTMLKDDLIKRKRIKNSIPSLNRCNAKRANGEQCTRRRKDKCEFCGTHVKGTPHGLIQTTEVNENIIQNIDYYIYFDESEALTEMMKLYNYQQHYF